MTWISLRNGNPRQYYKGIPIMASRGLHEVLADLVRDSIGPGARVLDCGTGAGAMSQRLSDEGYEVLSVDQNDDAFQAKTEFVHLNFDDSQAFEEFCEKHSEQFDVVLAGEIIEHLRNPWQFLAGLKRLARPGGHVIVSTPNITSWYARMRFLVKGYWPQFGPEGVEHGHINPIAKDELELIVRESGLVIQGIKPAGWLPRLWLWGKPMTVALNIMGFLLSPLMRGIWKGWCLVLWAQKPASQG